MKKDIEIYESEKWETEYCDSWWNTKRVAEQFGFDLEKWEFSQFISFEYKKNLYEEVSFVSKYNENVSLTITWENDRIQKVLVDMD